MTSSSVADAGQALCRCGRPLGHTGKHLGGLSPNGRKQTDRPREPRGNKLRSMLASEISAQQQAIGRLKAQIREGQEKLALAQARLPRLLECAEALDPKMLPAPPAVNASTHPMHAAGPPATIFQTTARREVPMVVEETALPEADGAILADFGTVLKFAMTRGMMFESWDDLPNINRKREDLNMATFKRKMGR